MKSRSLVIVFTALCITAAILVALVYWGQRHILFPRHAAPPALSESEMPSQAERIWLTHSDGRTEAWLFMNRVRKTPQPLVVFAHGNAELIDYQMPIVQGYQRMGLAVALLEYRGYGRSDGQPSEDAIVADGVALLDQLLERILTLVESSIMDAPWGVAFWHLCRTDVLRRCSSSSPHSVA